MNNLHQSHADGKVMTVSSLLWVAQCKHKVKRCVICCCLISAQERACSQTLQTYTSFGDAHFLVVLDCRMCIHSRRDEALSTGACLAGADNAKKNVSRWYCYVVSLSDSPGFTVVDAA